MKVFLKTPLVLLICFVLSVGAGCRDKDSPPYRFPRGFVWGAASSAYQTEGGNYNNDWYQWEKKNPLFIETPAGMAVNSYNLYDDDARLASDIHLTAYRFSVEWSRIEPERGVWDQQEIEHYRDMIRSLTQRGITPILTLHHYTNPIWVLNMDKENDPTTDLGCWQNPETAVEFAKYAAKLAQEFGSEVDWWLTINEPIAIIFSGYMVGVFPPGLVGLSTSRYYQVVLPVQKNLITAHALAYDAIKKNDLIDADGDGRASIVSLPESIALWDPADPDNPDDVQAVQRMLRFYTFNLFDGLTRGDFDNDLDGTPDENHPEWEGRADYIGFNYYNRWYVTSFPVLPAPISALPCVSLKGFDLGGSLGCPKITGEKSDMGYEVYPEGIYRMLRELSRRYSLPVLITENGMATTDGEKRAKFIMDHLWWVRKGLSEGIEVLGYLHWSLTDNWEWGSFDPRFGLYMVDYRDNFRRTLTEGGRVLGEIARCNCLTKN